MRHVPSVLLVLLGLYLLLATFLREAPATLQIRNTRAAATTLEIVDDGSVLDTFRLGRGEVLRLCPSERYPPDAVLRSHGAWRSRDIHLGRLGLRTGTLIILIEDDGYVREDRTRPVQVPNWDLH